MKPIEAWQLLACPLEDVQAWLIPVTHDAFHSNWKVLSEDERQRADRFHQDADRQRFVVTRGSLRHLLGQRLQISPEHIQIGYGPHQVPYLVDNPQTAFNVSHSGDFALIALTHEGSVGVDIERHRADIDVFEISGAYFHAPEIELLRTLEVDEQRHAFLLMWTFKEAVAKALKAGIAGVSPGVPEELLNCLSRSAPLPQAPVLMNDCRVCCVHAPNGYSAAIASYRPAPYQDISERARAPAEGRQSREQAHFSHDAHPKQS
jgi:4'-phosphopantetheinyl transferase